MGQPDSATRDQTIASLLKGAVDLHVHSGPSLMPRIVDHIEVVSQARDAGMAAILLKDHYYPTMPIAHLINKHFPSDVETLGAIVLNNPLGGLNPSAVDYALKQGARVVWMATAHAQNHLDHDKKDADFKNKFPVNSKKTVSPIGSRLVDGAGVVTEEVKRILDLIAEADAAVSGGHHHIDELWPFYEEARARGVKRLFLNHPTYVNDASFEDIGQLVRMGVMIEHSICMFIPSTFYLFDHDHLRKAIAAAGVDHTFFGSDLGQKNNPTPIEGFRQMIGLLLDLGYAEDDIRKMVAGNAARFNRCGMSNLGLRQRVAAREPLIGTFIKTPAAHQVELLRLSGLDFVVADAEHAPIGNAEIDRMIACAGDFPVLVRVARNEASMISSVLDLGAAGVVVPHIRSTGDAHAVLDAADFSRGCRGFSPSVRAGRFGTDTPEMYRHRADGERLVIAQIEDVEALENIDAIAAIETIDVLFVGPADLGLSMGCGSPDEPRLKHAIRSVADAGRRHGRAVGIFVGAVEGIPQYRAMGISFFICGSDQSFLIGEARRVKRTAFAAEYI